MQPVRKALVIVAACLALGVAGQTIVQGPRKPLTVATGNPGFYSVATNAWRSGSTVTATLDCSTETWRVALVYCTFYKSGGSISSVTVGASNATLVTSGSFFDGGGKTSLYYVTNTESGSRTVTVTFSAAPDEGSLVAMCITNGTTIGQSGGSYDTATDLTSFTNTVSSVTANSIFAGFATAGEGDVTMTPSAWMTKADGNASAGSGLHTSAGAYQLLAATTATNQWSKSGVAARWSAIAVEVKR